MPSPEQIRKATDSGLESDDDCAEVAQYFVLVSLEMELQALFTSQS